LRQERLDGHGSRAQRPSGPSAEGFRILRRSAVGRIARRAARPAAPRHERSLWRRFRPHHPGLFPGPEQPPPRPRAPRIMNGHVCYLLVSVSVVLGARPAPAQTAPGQPRDALEERVKHALKFLQTMQTPDGAWPSQGAKSAPITALAVMAFLSAGHVPGEGPYGATVEKGIRWV